MHRMMSISAGVSRKAVNHCVGDRLGIGFVFVFVVLPGPTRVTNVFRGPLAHKTWRRRVEKIRGMVPARAMLR